MRIRTHRVLSRSRLGFRGAILLALAFIDVVYGLSLLLPSEETRTGSAYAWRSQFFPTEGWGALWVLVGVFLVTQAWANRDRAAYGAAISIKGLWATVCVMSWVVGPVPASQAFALGGIFTAFGAVAFVCSLWPEPIVSHSITTMSDDQGGANDDE